MKNRYTFGISILLSYLIIYLQFLFRWPEFDLGRQWADQFNLLFFLSCGLSIILFVSKKTSIVWLILIIRFWVFLIIQYPLREYLGLRLTLLITLILEANAYLSVPYNIFSSTIIIFSLIFAQKDIIAWGRKLAGTSLVDLISLFYFSALLVIISSSLQIYFIRKKRQTEYTARLEETVQRLVRANVGFQQQTALVEEQSKEKERKRLTREIHDTIGYTFTNVMMMMEAVTDMLPKRSERARKTLMQAREQAEEGFNETRRLLRIMRSEEMKNIQGIEAIHKLIKTFSSATKVEVQVEYGNLRWSYGEEIDSAIYRLVQEGIANAFRHGKATKIKIVFWQNEDRIMINMHDNGSIKNKIEIKEGIGLSGMNERIEQLGGRINTLHTDNGFTISAWIPLRGKE
jgi:signal transduction histidine kinase